MHLYFTSQFRIWLILIPTWSATIDINSSFEHHHDLKIAYYRLSFIHSDSRLKSGNSSFAELEYQSVDKLTLFFMCDWISITSISLVKFSNWSIQFFIFLTSICVTCFPYVLTLWPHVMFCFAGCIDKLSLQRSLGNMIIFYFLKFDSFFNKFHCFSFLYTILNSQYGHFHFHSVNCVDSIWLLYRGNAAQILFLLSWSCSTVVIHRVVRVITIACNYSFIAWLNNVPNIIPVESFFGTIQYYFTFLDNQNRISDCR